MGEEVLQNLDHLSSRRVLCTSRVHGSPACQMFFSSVSVFALAVRVLTIGIRLPATVVHKFFALIKFLLYTGKKKYILYLFYSL